MSTGMLALLAFSPILLAAVLLIGLRWPARTAMPLVYVVTAAVALFVWDMSFNRVLASTLQGLVITIGLLWIIFGAILLLNTLKHSGGITAIRAGFTTVSPDRRIQPSSSPGCSAALSKAPRASVRRRRLLRRCWWRSASRRWLRF